MQHTRHCNWLVSTYCQLNIIRGEYYNSAKLCKKVNQIDYVIMQFANFNPLRFAKNSCQILIWRRIKILMHHNYAA